MDEPRYVSKHRPPVDVASARRGDLIAGKPLTLTLARVLAFSGGAFDEPGWPHANLHTDIGKAREAGLDAIIASGTQSEGLLLGLLIDTFGPEWHRSGKLEVRFLKPVQVGTVVQPMLRFGEVQPDTAGSRVSVECWCRTEADEKLIEGTASCTLPGGRRDV